MLDPAQLLATEDVPAPQQRLNRADRRAYAKLQKATQRKTMPELMRWHRSQQAKAFDPAKLLDDCRPYEEGELTARFIKIFAAFERLQDGSADEDDFQFVAQGMNIAKVRAMDIDEGLADEIERAQDAMKRCGKRYCETGKFGFSRTDLPLVQTALEIQQAIEEKSTPKQLNDAAKVVAKIINLQLQAKSKTK